jgi:hypothetical protein
VRDYHHYLIGGIVDEPREESARTKPSSSQTILVRLSVRYAELLRLREATLQAQSGLTSISGAARELGAGLGTYLADVRPGGVADAAAHAVDRAGHTKHQEPGSANPFQNPPPRPIHQEKRCAVATLSRNNVDFCGAHALSRLELSASLLHFLDKLILRRAKGGRHESHLRGELRTLGHDHLRSSEGRGTSAGILGQSEVRFEARAVSSANLHTIATAR